MQIAGYSRVASSDFRGDPDHPEGWLARRGEILRELPGRRVFRAEIGGEPVVVKEYSPRSLKRLLRSYAEDEGETALAVAARGVPVVRPLAWARLGDGRQILVLREEEGARSLQQVVLTDLPRGRARHALARNVGSLLARMQNAGVRHRDNHAGNVLVRPDGEVLLADARGLAPGTYLTPAQRARDLAVFALFFLTHASTVDLLVFWGAYGRASGLLPAALEELRHEIAARLPAAFRRLAGSRSRRTRRLGAEVRIGSMSGLRFRELPPGELDAMVERALHLSPGEDVLKASPTAWTLQRGAEIVYKVYLPKKATRPLRDLILGSRAKRNVVAAEALAHRGFQTPAVVAILDDSALPGRSVLVMERVRDARPIEEVARGLPPRALREMARRLGASLRRMHDWGLRHRDLKGDNLYATPDGAEFRFLDLDGVRQTLRGPLDWEKRKRDLANLGGSLLDRSLLPTGFRLRVLDAYLGAGHPPGQRPGAFTREVVRLAQQHEARRSGR